MLRVGHHHVPGLAPGSPVSNISTVRHNFTESKRGGNPFIINSHGGSSNRFSRAEPPHFAAVASSRFRTGDVINSKLTEQLKMTSERINESFELNGNGQYNSDDK